MSIYVYMHSCTHYDYAFVYTNMCTCMVLFLYFIYLCAHIYICKYMCKYIHIIYIYIHSYIHIRTYVHAYIHRQTNMHAYMHTYIHTHRAIIYRYPCFCVLVFLWFPFLVYIFRRFAPSHECLPTTLRFRLVVELRMPAHAVSL